MCLLATTARPASPDPLARPPDGRPSTGRGAGHQLLDTFIDSFKLLAIEHGLRIAFQEKTRDELGGQLLAGLPALAARARPVGRRRRLVGELHRPPDPRRRGRLHLARARRRSATRISRSLAATGRRGQRRSAWAAGYSVQFEFGPLSEASIGNVGLRPDTTGWVDHVVDTSSERSASIVAEDALDRFFVKWVEGHTRNRFFRAALRMTFNPSRTLSNATTGHLPWYREGRST